MTTDFLLGFLAGIVYSLALAALLVAWWLSRDPRPVEPRVWREARKVAGRG